VKGELVGAELLRERLGKVRARVDAAARAAGRRPGDAEIILATKYVPAERMGALLEAGVRLVGENRAQYLVAKHELYGEAFTWDFIGHLQSRKTRLVLPLVRLIHSVSSLSVVQELQRQAQNTITVLLEVNVAGEETKSGVAPHEVDAFLDAASACDKVSFGGLMCMPPLTPTKEAAAPYFAGLRELSERLSAAWAGRYTFAELSMGTSADYEVAVREGATKVRVGEAVLF
jgi:pyridoxal phosphate enzyme (YggS family)